MLEKDILLSKLECVNNEAMSSFCDCCGHSTRVLNAQYYYNATRFIDLLIKTDIKHYPDIQQCSEYIIFEWMDNENDKNFEKVVHVEIRENMLYMFFIKGYDRKRKTQTFDEPFNKEFIDIIKDIFG